MGKMDDGSSELANEAVLARDTRVAVQTLRERHAARCCAHRRRTLARILVRARGAHQPPRGAAVLQADVRYLCVRTLMHFGPLMTAYSRLAG